MKASDLVERLLDHKVQRVEVWVDTPAGVELTLTVHKDDLMLQIGSGFEGNEETGMRLVEVYGRLYFERQPAGY